MAKGKHSTALFEVINRPARTGVTPPPVITRAPLNVNVQPPPSASPASASTAAGKSVEVDRDRHQISLRVSYTSALVTAFAVIVIVSLAYLVGRGTNPATTIAGTSTEELKKGPANPAVLNVAGGTPAGNSTASTSNAQQAGGAVPASLPKGPVAAPTNVRRIVGQNYVIMQSYPDEATAKEAQSVLLGAGIPCTIERGPANWVPLTWYSVIGTQSFDRVTKNPQLDAYLSAVQSVKYGEKSKFKKFDPRAYKWK